MEGVARRSIAIGMSDMRAGDLLEWGCRNRILERVGGDRWALLERGPSWELFGQARSYAVRVRGLSGQAGAEAARLWKRESARRQRLDSKRLGALAKGVTRDIGMIVDMAPDTKLPPALAGFIAGDADTFAETRLLLLDSVRVMSVQEAGRMYDELETTVDVLIEAQLTQQLALEAGDAIGDDDLEAIADSMA